MYLKIVLVAFWLVCANAVPIQQQYHQATSFATFNQHHNTIQHIQSAPAVAKAAVAAVPVVHAAPIQVQVAPVHVAPVAIKASAPQSAQSYSSISFGHSSAPVAHISAPIITQPAVHAVVAVQHEEEYGPAKYEFAYGVEDHHTGDIHSQKESRDGDRTQGEYSLHEADGTIRTVKYTADKHSGFNAIVERSGHATHPQLTHAAAPVNHH